MVETAAAQAGRAQEAVRQEREGKPTEFHDEQVECRRAPAIRAGHRRRRSRNRRGWRASRLKVLLKYRADMMMKAYPRSTAAVRLPDSLK